MAQECYIAGNTCFHFFIFRTEQTIQMKHLNYIYEQTIMTVLLINAGNCVYSFVVNTLLQTSLYYYIKRSFAATELTYMF